MNPNIIRKTHGLTKTTNRHETMKHLEISSLFRYCAKHMCQQMVAKQEGVAFSRSTQYQTHDQTVQLKHIQRQFQESMKWPDGIVALGKPKDRARWCCMRCCYLMTRQIIECSQHLLEHLAEDNNNDAHKTVLIEVFHLQAWWNLNKQHQLHAWASVFTCPLPCFDFSRLRHTQLIAHVTSSDITWNMFFVLWSHACCIIHHTSPH